jgi:hypothetical protein
MGLPRVEEVANQQRHGRPRQDAAVEQLVRKSEDLLAEFLDQRR